ncbi:MAG: phosphogluconate dehydrogenase (NADP(+)-dependent, decarboxylating) [Deltaproteobacteria bacterium]|nr:MAG: phosphogluconate dehydrogenase (NADP(+)-dependent, decarboxylating) [Deltaproteobacteria bacterium]
MNRERLNDVAVIGLGVMGSSLARNFASRGLAVSGFDLDVEGARAMAAKYPEAKLDIAASTEELVRGLERPRRIILLVNAGRAVDAVLDSLDPLLEADDIVVDGGNSLYRDTDRRNARAKERPWRFVGMGVSGGAEGALLGPAMMPGGDAEAWDRLKPVLESIAATSPSGPCVGYCGRGSAGHFVKMVHNGIEYGDMQLIAETSVLLRKGLGKSATEVGEIFAKWNEGELESFLVEITANIFRTPDPAKADTALVDAILDQAGQKGTGRWTVLTAVELGIPVPTIAAAVDGRALSSFRDLRSQAEAAYEPSRSALRDLTVEDLGKALYASKIASYTQGFQLLAAASEEFDFGTDLGEVSRIWTAGCIIRARFLDRIRESYGTGTPPALLALAPGFVADLSGRVPAWRKVVSQATAAGYPVPGFAASLSWFDTLTTARGSANVIQAQRDYFGSHTYRRLEAPETPVHTDWPRFD